MTLLRRTFASIRVHRNYRLYFFGQIGALSGTWMQNVALYWVVLDLTHSPVAVGVLSLARFGPFGVLGLFTGVVADRFDNRKTVIAAQAAQMGCSVILAGLALGGVMHTWELYALAALTGTAAVFDQPVRQNLITQMVGRAELPNAVALNSSLGTIARTVGPALAGVVIAAFGAGWCFALNAVGFLGVLAALIAMRPSEFFPLHNRTRPSLWRGTWEGLVYAGRRKRVWVLVGVAIVMLSFALNVNVLLPVLAKRTLDAGPRTFGTISACFGLGALFGALTSAALGRLRWRFILGAPALCGIAELAVAPLHTLVLVCVLLAVIGFTFSTFAAGSMTTLQLDTPDHIRGRVLGLYGYAWNGPPAFLSPVLGWLCATGGTELAFFISGLLALLVAVAAAAVIGGAAPRGGREEEPVILTA
jgi:MFS family permease